MPCMIARLAPMTTSVTRAVAGLALMAAGFSATGCSVVNAVRNAAHAVSANKRIIEGFANQLNSTVTTFEATYDTTGTTHATVLYAVQPPQGLLFKTTATVD